MISNTRVISHTTKIDGVLTDMDAVLLGDEAGAFGVRRTDTGAAVVPAATPMVRASLGSYTCTFTEPAPGLIYEHALTIVYNGETEYSGTITEGASALGIYTNQIAIIAIFGTVNIAQWSSLDGEIETPNVARIQSAIDASDALITRYATLYGYATPIASTIPSWGWLTRLAAEDAGVELFVARGLGDSTKAWAGQMAQRRLELRGDPSKGVMGEIERFFYAGVLGATKLPASDVSFGDTFVIGSSNVFAQQACRPCRQW